MARRHVEGRRSLWKRIDRRTGVRRYRQRKILINHAFLWRGGRESELPDLSGRLPEIRRLLDEHRIDEADAVFTEAAREKGFDSSITASTPVCDIVIHQDQRKHGIFSHYRREVDMSRAEVCVSWREGNAKYTRRTFASRDNQLLFTKISCTGGTICADVGLEMHDPETIRDFDLQKQENFARGDKSYYTAWNESVYRPGDYGAVCKVITDGEKTAAGHLIHVEGAAEILLVVSTFCSVPRTDGFREAETILDSRNFCYEEELEKHTEIHSALFNAVDFSIAEETAQTSNEELLLEAFEDSASNEMIEKMYAYGRYLFICSTSDRNSLPCHLIGLFNGTYWGYWSFTMFNVNFEMIYWQALSGNLPGFLRLALDYVEAMVPDFQNNAKKIYGCRGIYVNSVNTPESGQSKCFGRHIINWTGGAAWIAQHFWDYYRFTQDEKYLREHAMPFMYQTALFYEDFAVEGKDGYYDLYPSVSPENTPKNVKHGDYFRNVETNKNATMELALMKEVLTNLIEGSRLIGMYAEKVDKWEKMLSKIRPYRINQDGAVQEWTDDFCEDYYEHRHQSHLYPVFPGHEIGIGHPLLPAFKRAEELRWQEGLKDQSNWSMVYMAGVNARMRQGNEALMDLDTMSRLCVINNFFTLSNDWRRMGPVMCEDMRAAPFQIDGNCGFPGVVNEMLLQSQNDDLVILPALPDKWTKGHMNGLLARGNIICDLCWNEKQVEIRLRGNAQHKSVILCSGYHFEDGSTEKRIDLAGETVIQACR